jgi:hypothetical protein
MREKPNVDASPWRERRNARTPRPHNIRGTGGPQGSPRSEADQGVVPGPGALTRRHRQTVGHQAA